MATDRLDGKDVGQMLEQYTKQLIMPSSRRQHARKKKHIKNSKACSVRITALIQPSCDSSLFAEKALIDRIMLYFD